MGFDPVFGARPLKRAIQQRIENPISKLLLEGKFMPKDMIGADVDPIKAPGQFSFEQEGGYLGIVCVGLQTAWANRSLITQAYLEIRQ